MKMKKRNEKNGNMKLSLNNKLERLSLRTKHTHEEQSAFWEEVKKSIT